MPVVQNSLLTEPLTSLPRQPKKHGGPRPVLLQPPLHLLFDDPAETQGSKEQPHIVSGRIAKIRFALMQQALHLRVTAYWMHVYKYAALIGCAQFLLVAAHASRLELMTNTVICVA